MNDRVPFPMFKNVKCMLDQKLRQPVFLGLRDDKRPQDVTLPEAR